MMNCKKATRLLSEQLDRKLTLRERVALSIHLSMCSGCRNFSKQMDVIRGFCKSYADSDIKVGFKKPEERPSDNQNSNSDGKA